MTTRKIMLGSLTLLFCLLITLTNGQNTGYPTATALTSITSGTDNSAFGAYSLANTTSGSKNTGVGVSALRANTSGNGNSALGYRAGFSITTGQYITAIGHEALLNNTASYNTAVGYGASLNNSSGAGNVAIGYNAMNNNSTGENNTSVGFLSNYSGTTGEYNVAVGSQSQYSLTTGIRNVGIGFNANFSNSTGGTNTAVGYGALSANTGSASTAIGYLAGSGFAGNTNCTYVGHGADASATGYTYSSAFGASATVNASYKIRIGSTNVTVIEGNVAYTTSDGRFKTNVTEEVKGLEFIKKLRPVVYNFEARKFDEFLMKNMADSTKKERLSQTNYEPATAIRQSGFIAQEVEKAAKETGYNFNGVHVPVDGNDNYSLAYGQFVVPLVKGMQEQQKTIEVQNATMQNQQQLLAEAMQKIDALNIKLQELEGSVKSTGDNSLLPKQFNPQLFDAQPNPTSGKVNIKYFIPENAKNPFILLTDINGKEQQTIALTAMGTSSVEIDASNLTGGTYLYSLIADGNKYSTKKLIVIAK